MERGRLKERETGMKREQRGLKRKEGDRIYTDDGQIFTMDRWTNGWLVMTYLSHNGEAVSCSYHTVPCQRRRG